MEKKTILFPIDFSERADNALKKVIPFARSLNAKIILYHVYHRPVSTTHDASNESLLRRATTIVDEKFEKLIENHPELKHIDYQVVKELGIFVDNILTFSKNADFIVMATKGASGFGELLGTKTAIIIKDIEIPALILSDNASLENLKKIGLACDYSSSTEYEPLKFLGKFAEQLELDVDVITLNRDEKKMTRSEVQNRKTVTEILNDIPASFNFSTQHNVEEGLMQYCDSNNIQMIAILPKNYNFIGRIFHESFTEKMVFHCPLPLLVLK